MGYTVRLGLLFVYVMTGSASCCSSQKGADPFTTIVITGLLHITL